MKGALPRLALACAALLVAAGPLDAAPLPDPDAPYSYVAVERSVRDALSDFSVNTGLLLRLSEKVQGRLAPRPYRTTVRGFLDEITREFELVWYYDGATLHVYHADEVLTRMMRLRGVAPDRLARELSVLGIWDARFPIRISRDDTIILASGPPRYLALVELVLADLIRRREEGVQVNRRGAWSSQSDAG
ncbi:MAG: hypothetical protein LPL00_04135, partial [Alphaproteobacteria bacterium]|nr:hypothetical protein [Alphaproteobacteria bacterium]MDX5368681.1 hypothetical protein [Alphaproteobacteria bacterium]MDX5463426.1 hypothetical protein [Alphaproteobacteria bacterium]